MIGWRYFQQGIFTMAVHDLKELKSLIKPKMRILGMDQGTKTIGLALSDERLCIATPLETIKRKKFTADITHIADLMRAYNVSAFVIGLPINMNGTEGPRCQSVRHFGDNLLRLGRDIFDHEPHIAFWDERLSTSAVERFLIDEVDMNRKRRSEVIDKMAACHILQGALDFLQN
jgi:putative Holliday junction resolvase